MEISHPIPLQTVKIFSFFNSVDRCSEVVFHNNIGDLDCKHILDKEIAQERCYFLLYPWSCVNTTETLANL